MTTVIGEQALDFVLPSSDGKQVRLSDYKGKNVVLYFYPKDMTPGCTVQACDFRDMSQEFADVNTVVLGVSPDPISSHLKFIEKHGLTFTLLADENQEVANAYDVWKLKKNFGKEYMGIERSTFLMNTDGILVKEWRKVTAKGHADELLAYIKENL
ncbi:thioredoxin-dependent thiol peroxidase [Bacillus massiliigorillae]|uniref:thioredoxin-dependent thiol peroxidase n=1 Tax=Bacillus massiliigorillae TaxID=1243664 RepID=UPI0003A743EB|nr:thioredoxin-dependent thiol peroxidase [Bacillus massiliigorillae]